MGIIKDRHGTFYVQRRVPERLQEAVARVLNKGERRVFLKKSLGTKTLREAKAAAPHVLADFNRIVGEAEGLLKERPVVTVLTHTQIKRLAEHVYATALKEDEELRLSGRLAIIGPHDENVNADALGDIVQDFRQQFAAGDVSFAEQHAQNALANFGITLNQSSTAYHTLCIESAKALLRALDDIGLRYEGAVIETPRLPDPKALIGHGEGNTLQDALEGWQKVRQRPDGTVHEYARAVEMFIQLHGNIPVANMKRSHARMFREAVQLVPKTRKGELLKAGLPELSQWGREHPKATKVSAATVNKQLGAVQAIAKWGFNNGLVPDDVAWSDPFAEMRLEEERSTREPFNRKELQAIFNAPLFTNPGATPEGGKGPAAVWLPLLALFTGGRQAEFAGLRVSDIRDDDDSGAALIWIERSNGRSVKTGTSERVVPVHSELVSLGFLKHVAARKREDGDKAWLFPLIAPDQKGGLRAWSKWFGHYLSSAHIGIDDADKVFHSFRHGFTDRARQSGVAEDVRKALMGHSDASTVSGGYGAKGMLQRWTALVLTEAIEKINYPGLDLSRVKAPLGERPPITRQGEARHKP
jgi:integrase